MTDKHTAAPAVRDAVRALVAHRPGITLLALLEGDTGADADDLNALIAAGEVYVDLRAAPLSQPDRVRVFPDAETADFLRAAASTPRPAPDHRPAVVELATNAVVTWNGRGWRVINVGETEITMFDEDGEPATIPVATFEKLARDGAIKGVGGPPEADRAAGARERMRRATPGDLREAVRRQEIIRPHLAGAPIREDKCPTPASTRRDWTRSYRAAEAAYGPDWGLIGLLPRHGEKGNHTKRLPDRVEELITKQIKEDHATAVNKDVATVYGALIRSCEGEGLDAPSYPTVINRINDRPRGDRVREREGEKRAYAHEAPYVELEFTTPRHGERPFQVVHLDHTQLDILTCCPRTGKPLGKPWQTLLTDAFSRRVLAHTLSYDPPSYRSSMLVMRECVRRHGRLPQLVLVDGGSDFGSVYFETLLARFMVTKKSRAAAKARYGSVLERLFGTENTHLIHNLAGNTQLMKNVRQVTAKVDPTRHAVWTLPHLYFHIDRWAYENYDTIVHPALHQSPRDAFAAGMVAGGRKRALIAYDDDFIRLTWPTTAKGTAKVVRGSGVKLNRLYYWNDAFRYVEGQVVDVRYDPFDMGRAMAYVKGEWVDCISYRPALLQGRSERELNVIAEEIRRNDQLHAAGRPVTQKQIADYLAGAQSDQVKLQRLRDEAALAARQIVGMTAAEASALLDGSAPGPAAVAPGPASTAGRHPLGLPQPDAAALIIPGGYTKGGGR